MKKEDALLHCTKEFVKMAQSTFVSGTQLMNLIEKIYPAAKDNLEISIYAMHQIVEMARLLPEKFFKDPKSQQQFVAAAQKKLDELVLQEEESIAEDQPLSSTSL